MLDKFLDVAYQHHKKAEAQQDLVNLLRKLPDSELHKIASGKIKLGCSPGGYDSSTQWLDRFKDTPLFEQAIELEKQELEVRMLNDQRRQEEQASWRETDAKRDQLSIQRKLLELQLAELEEGGGEEVDEEVGEEELAADQGLGEEQAAATVEATPAEGAEPNQAVPVPAMGPEVKTAQLDAVDYELMKQRMKLAATYGQIVRQAARHAERKAVRSAAAAAPKTPSVVTSPIKKVGAVIPTTPLNPMEQERLSRYEKVFRDAYMGRGAATLGASGALTGALMGATLSPSGQRLSRALGHAGALGAGTALLGAVAGRRAGKAIGKREALLNIGDVRAGKHFQAVAGRAGLLNRPPSSVPISTSAPAEQPKIAQDQSLGELEERTLREHVLAGRRAGRSVGARHGGKSGLLTGTTGAGAATLAGLVAATKGGHLKGKPGLALKLLGGGTALGGLAGTSVGALQGSKKGGRVGEQLGAQQAMRMNLMRRAAIMDALQKSRGIDKGASIQKEAFNPIPALQAGGKALMGTAKGLKGYALGAGRNVGAAYTGAGGGMAGLRAAGTMGKSVGGQGLRMAGQWAGAHPYQAMGAAGATGLGAGSLMSD